LNCQGINRKVVIHRPRAALPKMSQGRNRCEIG
jgi:hypothetical protein